MKSMTGFAKKQCILPNQKYTIEIKTLNSKGMDVIVKTPASLHDRELDIREKLNRLERGKIELLVTEESNNANTSQLDETLFRTRYSQLLHLSEELQGSGKGLFDAIVSMPDVWVNKTSGDLSDEDWQQVSRALDECIDEVEAFRCHEGAVLQTDIDKHVDCIEQRLMLIPQYEQERIATAKERIQHYFEDYAIKEIDSNRFEQELIYYLEKLDITEEKVRLKKHIDYFRHTVANEDCCGKKLGFIAQEMGREINTTGSKANHVDIQRLVVEMKDELEKIKEQLGNIL